jgi:RsiW-degrading membrane proteinase PrsW (M82 family)
MRYFISYNGRTFGPYLERDLIDWWKVRQIPDDALICDPVSGVWKPLASEMPARRLSPREEREKEALSGKTNSLSPWSWLTASGVFGSLAWLREGELLMLVIVGLFPIAAATVFPVLNTFWTISIYFSILWALFLFHFFRTPETRVAACVVAFMFTPVFSVATLLEAQQTTVLRFLDSAAYSTDFWTRFTGFVVGVGVSEELCKAAVVLLIVWRARIPFSPSTSMLYGMMSGLGFGIFEGLFYQQYVNPSAGYETGYLLNILRITSIPFLHSMWAGLSAYFIGTSRFLTKGRWIFTLIGLSAAAILHGTYDQFSGTWPSIVISVLSVAIVFVYVMNCRRLEPSLRIVS